MISFGLIGVEHGHADVIVHRLCQAGAIFKSVHCQNKAAAVEIAGSYDGVALANSAEDIIENPEIQLVVCVTQPSERAAISVACLRAGKAVLCAKPAAINSHDILLIRKELENSSAIWRVFYSEVVDCPATQYALDQCRQGRIGEIRHIMGLAPHRLSPETRPDWFLDPRKAGGILADIASHQAYQFLTLANVEDADITHAKMTRASPKFMEQFNDMAEIGFSSGSILGYSRIDWLTPKGLPTWGDGRLFITGSTGSIEVRKNGDFSTSGVPIVMLTDEYGVHLVKTFKATCMFAQDFIQEIVSQRPVVKAQLRALNATDLAIKAQKLAEHNGRENRV